MGARFKKIKRHHQRIEVVAGNKRLEHCATRGREWYVFKDYRGIG